MTTTNALTFTSFARDDVRATHKIRFALTRDSKLLTTTPLREQHAGRRLPDPTTEITRLRAASG